MRIRTVKPSFWKSETLSTVPKEHRLLAIALLNYADDDGYFQANEALIRGECFPFDEDSTSVRLGLDDLSNIGYLVLGTTPEGQRIGRVLNFLDHQKIDKATPSKLKDKSITWDRVVDDSPSPPRKVGDASLTEVGREVEGKGVSPASRRNPTKTPLPESFKPSERVTKWAASRGIDAGQLAQHCEIFVTKCQANAYRYADWDAALMGAVRDNWAKLGKVVPIRDEFKGVR